MAKNDAEVNGDDSVVELFANIEVQDRSFRDCIEDKKRELDRTKGDIPAIWAHVNECRIDLAEAKGDTPAILEVFRREMSYFCRKLHDYWEVFLALQPDGVVRAAGRIKPGFPR